MALTIFQQLRKNVAVLHTHNETMRDIQESAGNIEQIRSDNELIAKKKAFDTFTVKALVVLRTSSFKKKSFTGNEFESCYLILRITESIPQNDMLAKDIRLLKDKYGNAYYSFKVPCNLSKKKLEEYKVVQEAMIRDTQISEKFSGKNGTSSSSPNSSSSINVKKRDAASMTNQPTVSDISDNPNVTDKDDSSYDPKNKKRKIDSSTSVSVKTGSSVTNTDNNSTKYPKLLLKGAQHQPPQQQTQLILHRSDSRHNSPQTQLQVSVSEQDEQATPNDGAFEYGSSQTEYISGSNEEDPDRVYEYQELQGKPYKGRQVFVNVNLPINRQVMFNIEEKVAANPPDSWNIITAEIKANPYVDGEGKYRLDNWSVVSIKECEHLDPLLIYKHFESIGSSHRYSVMMSDYYESFQAGLVSKMTEKEELKFRFNENNTMLFVVGNTLTNPGILETRLGGHHVYFELQRHTDIAKFSRKVENEAPKYVIPYHFKCVQWDGPGVPEMYDCQTLMKFSLFFEIKMVHVCPEKKPGPTLGINSATAWEALIPSMYSHIKMAMISVEDSKLTAMNSFNTDRYLEGAHKDKKTGKIIKDINHINNPRKERSDRNTRMAFVLYASPKQVVLLPLQTLKSCIIRIPEEYICKDDVWGQQGKKKPKPFDGVAGKQINENYGIVCLSETSDVSVMFSSPSKNKGQKSYNFYALLNIIYRDNHDENLTHHISFSEKEGQTFIEALRNIASDGVVAGLFVKQQSIPPKQIQGNSIDEKYTNFLKKNGIPDDSSLYKIDIRGISFTGKEPRNLFVYFYAIPITRDDTLQDQTILTNLIEGISPDDMCKLSGAISDKESSMPQENNNNNMMLDTKAADDVDDQVDMNNLNDESDVDRKGQETVNMSKGDDHMDRTKGALLDDYFEDDNVETIQQTAEEDNNVNKTDVPMDASNDSSSQLQHKSKKLDKKSLTKSRSISSSTKKRKELLEEDEEAQLLQSDEDE